MIRPYLRDLINEHKLIDESNDDYDDDDDDDGGDDTDRAEWKIQLAMQNSCISTKNFEETCTIYSKSEPVEIFMGSDTKFSLMHFLIHFYKVSTCTRNIKLKRKRIYSWKCWIIILSFSKNRH